MFRTRTIGISLLSVFFCLPSQAQVNSDGTTNTTVDSEGNNFTVRQGDRAGNNLFHSFQDFSVPNEGSASFDNANDISNIFSRVTGGTISNIDGLIRANGNANLFLINPAGIIFGRDARLDVGGSFYGSTADSILFPDDLEFSATDSQTAPILTINAPIGLNFRDNPGEIVNRSIFEGLGLQVSPGENIGLIGGEVRNEGGILTALDGNIFLGGLETSGNVTIDNDSEISIPENTTRADITVNNEASFTVRAEGEGTITLVGNTVEIAEAEIRTGVDVGLGNQDILPGELTIDASNEVNISNSLVSGATLGFGNGGDLNILAGRNINLNGSQIGAGAFQVEPGTVGNSGNINLTADTIQIDNQSVLSTITDSEGSAGDFNIQATTLSLDNASIILSSTISESSDAGDINVRVNNLSLANGGGLSNVTEGAGSAGSISVIANDSITITGNAPTEIIDGFPGGFSSGLFSNSDELATGEGGTVTISTNRLEIADGGTISARTRTEGNGGDVIVNANSLEIAGGGQIVATAFGEGDAGNITLNISEEINIRGNDPTFENRREAVIALNSELDPTLAVDPEDTIDPVSPESGVFANSSSNSKGNSGSVFISGLSAENGSTSSYVEQITLDDTAQISVNSEGEGDGGNLFIKANLLDVQNNAAVLAGTPNGQGGEIELEILDNLTLQDTGLISARATNDANGGNITIDTNFIIAFPTGNNDIIASAEEGQGGNITINAESLLGIEERTLNSNTNDINASSEFSLDGNININTTEINPIQGSTELPSNIVDSVTTTAQACQLNREAKSKNGLTIAGKGGVPSAPELVLNSEIIAINGENADSISAIEEPVKTAQGKIKPARGINVTKSGEVILTAYRTNNAGDRLPKVRNCG